MEIFTDWRCPGKDQEGAGKPLMFLTPLQAQPRQEEQGPLLFAPVCLSP